MFEGELVSYIRPSFLLEGGSALPQSDFPLETRPFWPKSFNLASYTSNTTRVVSFDIQIPLCDISNTIHLIIKHQEVIYQTRGGVFHLISKQYK